MSNLEMRESDHFESGQDSRSPTPQFAATGEPSYGRTLLLGPDGLRPGWGLAFYALAFYILQWFLVGLAYSRDLGYSGLWSSLLGEIGSLLAALVPALVLARVERRRWREYGLPSHSAFGSQFWIGGLWGLAAISLLILLLFGARCFSFGHIVLHSLRLAKFAVFWGVFFLIVGIFEEFLLRGYSQYTLARGVGFWPAAVALSCAFGLIHLKNDQEQWPGLLAAMFIGLFFCLTLRRTGNLWFAVGFHAAWDWGETFFYSVPDSGMTAPGHLLSSSLHGPVWLTGGTVGPEGSVLCFLVIALVAVVFTKVHPVPRIPMHAQSSVAINPTLPEP